MSRDRISSTPSAYALARGRFGLVDRPLLHVVHAEIFGRLVEQDDVGDGPAVARFAAKAIPFGPGQLRRRDLQRDRIGVQVGQQLFGREFRPKLGQRGLHR